MEIIKSVYKSFDEIVNIENHLPSDKGNDIYKTLSVNKSIR